jgi:hypothetical protein
MDSMDTIVTNGQNAVSGIIQSMDSMNINDATTTYSAIYNDVQLMGYLRDDANPTITTNIVQPTTRPDINRIVADSAKLTRIEWTVELNLDDFSEYELNRIFTIERINHLVAFIGGTPFPMPVWSNELLCISIIIARYTSSHTYLIEDLIRKKLCHDNTNRFEVLSRELKSAKAEEQKYFENLSALIDIHAASGDPSITLDAKRFRFREIQAEMLALIAAGNVIDRTVSQIRSFMTSKRMKDFANLGKEERNCRFDYCRAVRVIKHLENLACYEQKFRTVNDEMQKAFEKCLTLAKNLYIAILKDNVEWFEKMHQEALTMRCISDRQEFINEQIGKHDQAARRSPEHYQYIMYMTTTLPVLEHLDSYKRETENLPSVIERYDTIASKYETALKDLFGINIKVADLGIVRSWFGRRRSDE